MSIYSCKKFIFLTKKPPPQRGPFQGEYVNDVTIVTIGTSGIEPETRVKARHLPLVVYAVVALEANQGDKRKRYYVPAQVRANRPQAVTPGGRKSH